MTEYDASTYMPEQGQLELPKECLQALEEEDVKSDSSSTASAVNSGQGQVEQVNPVDIQQEISARFEAAKKELDKVESSANKKKSEIVQQLTRDLEGKMPTDEIAAEIVRQLRGWISGRRIYECLEGEQYAKYKKKHRVENARKRHVRKDQTELAAEPQLKEEVAVLASGQETILKPSHSPEENLAKTQEVSYDGPIVVVASRASKQDEITRYVSHISIPFERLRRDMYAVAQRTNDMGNVFWKLSVNLTTRVAEIEFCGITQQKDVTMISTGRGILIEAN